jgi:hypothetical protein
MSENGVGEGEAWFALAMRTELQSCGFQQSLDTVT